MKVYLFEPRYWFHAFVTAIDSREPIPYAKWKRQMIEADYTFPKAFFGYTHGLDRLNVWRWAITDRRFLHDLVLFAFVLALVMARRWLRGKA